MDTYMDLATRQGLQGAEALEFAAKMFEKDMEREERRQEREQTRLREEKEREERENEREKEREEREKQRREREKERAHELEMARLRSDTGSDADSATRTLIHGPKMPVFDEERDNIDAFIRRFERHARLHNWPEEQWSELLSALLTGRALETYSRMADDKACKYDDLKAALLERYGLTPEGYRLKLRRISPEPDESPAQLLARIETYLTRWIELSDTEASYHGLFDLFVTEQFLEACPLALQIYLKERGCSGTEEVVQHAAQYLTAHGSTLETLPKPPATGRMSSATALPAFTGSSNSCVFCNYPHESSACRKARSWSVKERRDRLIQIGACFWCLEPRHRAMQCPAKRPKCEKCHGPHHPLLCERGFRSSPDTATTAYRMSGPHPAVTATVSSSLSDGSSATVTTATAGTAGPRPSRGVILMQTAQVLASGESGHARKVRVMFDSGSNQTFIRSDLARDIQCPSLGESNVSIQTFGGATLNQKLPIVQVALKGLSPGSRTLTITALETPIICASPPKATAEALRHAHLHGLNLAESVTSEDDDLLVSLLIGQDYMHEMIDGRIRKGNTGPVALGSHFGWLLSGPAEEGMRNAENSVISNFVHTSSHTVKTHLEDLWELEAIGISAEGALENKNKTSDEAAINHFRRTVMRLPDGRYEVSWPWKEGKEAAVQTNEALARARLATCEEALRRHGRLGEYDDAIQNYLDDGHAEKAPVDPQGRVHYLPHHAVYRNDKVRIVFDAAAGQKNALNGHINAGPNLITDLTGLLIRFRLRKVALVGDLEKAFLQMALHPTDRDVTRFMWKENASDPEPTIYRMTRVLFGINASPFLLQATIRHHLELYEQSDPELVEILRRDIYCDDFITSVDSEQDAERIQTRTQAIFRDACMVMTKWATSASGDKLPRQLGGDCDSRRKVLGVTWHPSADVLKVGAGALANVAEGAPVTKRTILRIAASFYDPLGLVAAFSVRLKMLLRMLWQQGCGWDEPIAPGPRMIWRRFVAELAQLDFSIPRFYGEHRGSFQLHVFSDASQDAMAAVVYFRTSIDKPIQDTALLICKARLTPSQTLTMPRLELTAALIGARLLSFVKRQLPIKPQLEFLWSDSLVALHWIRSEAQRWGPYVRNRVQEIQRLTALEDWKHCPGVDNPADLPSRGAAVSVVTQDLWIRGPEWLRHPPSKWPASCREEQEPAECEAEKVKDTQVHATLARRENDGIGQIVIAKNYSTLNRLHRVTAWIVRWTRKARGLEDRTGELSSEEIYGAERIWLTQVQTDAFLGEKTAIQGGHPIPRTSGIFQLNPFIGEGLLKLTGRLQESELSTAEKHPVILPSEHHYTKLVVMDLHEKLCHAGVQQTMFALRARFWITKCRQTVRQIIRSCMKCRVFCTKPFTQEAAPLPKERVCGGAPFSCIGVDLGGPLYARDSRTSDPKKVYFVLFTCTAVRAVHLELVESLSTEDFMKAFERFTARRGRPSVVFSDNATNFRGAAPQLAHAGVQWKFNVPRAPWWGGFFERLIRTTKEALRKTLHQSLMTLSELHTVLCRIEGVINARPLTPVTEDVNDVRALAPEDFLRDTSLDSRRAIPMGLEQEPRPGGYLTARWRYRRQIVDHLWRRWSREYVRELRGLRRPPEGDVEPRIGDLVLIADDRDGSPVFWKKARITQLHHGRDGRVRSATVRTGDRHLTRAIQSFHLLEAA